MPITVLDPTQQPFALDAPTHVPAPRLSTLNGKTLGLWNNRKLNAERFLEQMKDELEQYYSFQVVRGIYDPGRAMADDEWGEVAKCDAVILANGDCGACSTSGIVNAIELEKKGIPTLLVSTPPFLQAVKTSAELRGMPAIQWAVVEHPIACLSEEELKARAIAAVPQFLALILQAPAERSRPDRAAATIRHTMQYDLEDYEEAVEFYHRKGWTDGLPIIPPTPARVERFLAAANRKPDEQIGVYNERRIPVTVEKLAINAVMAGCLPEYFPVVIALVEGIFSADMLHVANSSTGSFTYGFVVNGPIRNVLGMNWRGNVLGPGNRANSSIGRALRLIQINILGSIPGAGFDNPAHGRPVLDRSMMGQPAKYAGYHIVENEEDFPSLIPLHVERGFQPTDSTVTVFVVAGYTWMDGHAEQTPDAWIDSFAHYVVGAGKLVASTYAVMLLPPENARLFVNAGWTKADIRAALYERTRRSVAWVKSNGWKVTMQRERCEPVLPGDEETTMAISGAPEDLHVVVCGGPAGSWPYYLYAPGGASKAVTKTIAG